jgi:hypothetical protein
MRISHHANAHHGTIALLACPLLTNAAPHSLYMLRGRCFSVVIAESMFYNHEETPVYPLYIDPIHDFGYEAADTTLYHCNRRVVTAPHTHSHTLAPLAGWLVGLCSQILSI